MRIRAPTASQQLCNQLMQKRQQKCEMSTGHQTSASPSSVLFLIF